MNFKKPVSVIIAASMFMSVFLFSANAAETPANDFEYDVSSGEAVISAYNGNESSIVIPAVCAVDGKLYDVTKIGEEAFSGTEVENIEISEGITVISESAFWNCDGLTEVSIPESVTEIGNYAFDDCNNLVKVTVLNDNAVIGDSAFGFYAVGRKYYIVEGFVLYGSADSATKKYADSNGMEFTEYTKPVLGDVNNDGSLDLIDLIRLKKALASLDGKTDINGDGKCSAADMVTMKLLLLNGISELPMHNVIFKGNDGNILKLQKVRHSFAAAAPEAPSVGGFKFTGWSDDFSGIMQDTEITAVYETDNSPTFTVEKISSDAGSRSLKVAVNVKNNPGILGMTLSVEYDEENLTLTDAQCGEALKSVLSFTKSNILKSGCNFVWDGQELSDSDIKNGAILYLTFDVSENAVSGSYPITVSYKSGDIIDSDLNSVEFEIENGAITVN